MSKNHTTESDILPINTDFPINNKYKSINFNSRIRQIIIHYTAEDTQKSFDTLLGKDKNKVSAHYIINNALTEKYPDFIYQIVSDSKRSWHAGVSTWGNDSDLNNSSIGIEIVNLDGNVDAYPEEQFQAIVFLVKKLKQLYKVKDVDIIGHSDIAPSRKVDPGKLFPWERLAKSGASAWYDESDVEYFRSTLETAPNDEIGKEKLIEYGYHIDKHIKDLKQYKFVVAAFQRHFRPSGVDSIMDVETYAILLALLKKYR